MAFSSAIVYRSGRAVSASAGNLHTGRHFADELRTNSFNSRFNVPGKSIGEVEEVAALAALVQGAELCGQQFVERICVDFTVAPEPARVNFK